MAFKPLHDRVLVRRIESDEKTKGGLIIPDTAKEKPAEGEIVAVGAGTRDEDGDRIALDVKAGDRILFGKWSGTEITLEGEEKTAGGLIIPDSAKEKPAEGVVVAVGEGARDEAGKRIPMDVKEGDKILFGKWSGTEISLDGEELLIMKESDILGVIS